jgi:hypothetical protein
MKYNKYQRKNLRYLERTEKKRQDKIAEAEDRLQAINAIKAHFTKQNPTALDLKQTLEKNWK